MNSTFAPLVLGAVVGLVLLPLLAIAARSFTVEVEDGETALVTRFGKLVRTISTPGLHALPTRALPWVRVHTVSLRRDFRHYRDVYVNDSRGTTLMIDLWLELRITEPARALFDVADWDRSLRNLVSHAATSILCDREFRDILCDRDDLGEQLRREIDAETTRWGIAVELVFIHSVNLLPDVAQQLFATVAARLERAKADIEEEGRQRVSLLEAQTSSQVAPLLADAKGQYPSAVGRALSRLRSRPSVLKAYEELYELSVLRPHRTISFRGFEQGVGPSAAEAAMMLPPSLDAGPAGSAAVHAQAHALAPLGGHDELKLV